MANPTTNYGFVLPTPTDLVTDLPADFDIALQGVDTRLKALQPGTTSGDLAYSSATANTNVRLGIGTAGQVLAVVGGVPAWATTADQTPLTTKGDLFTFTTVDARLAVGATNGMVLTVDSAEATGLKYALPASGSSFVGCYAFIDSSGVNIANTTFSTIAFTGEQFDTDSFHSNSVNNSRITIPAGKAGKYLFTAQTYFDANATGKRALWLAFNGSRTGVSAASSENAGSTAANIGSQLSIVVNAAVADYFELQCYQNSGGNLFLAGDDYGGTDLGRGLTFFQCTYLGA